MPLDWHRDMMMLYATYLIALTDALGFPTGNAVEVRLVIVNDPMMGVKADNTKTKFKVQI